MALAIIGSSLKTLPQLAMPRLVVRAMLPFRYLWLTPGTTPLPPRQEAADIPPRHNEQPRSGVKRASSSPSAFHRRSVTTRREISRGLGDAACPARSAL